MAKQERTGLKERLIKNSFWAFASSLINRAGALIFTIILARFLLPEKYGVYSIVLSTAMIFFTFADLGINSTLVRYVSHAISKDKRKTYLYYNYLLKLKLILAFAVSTSLLILSYPLAFNFFKNSSLFLPFIIASVYIFILSLETFYTSFFYTIEKIKYISIKESLNQILRIVFALFVFYFIANAYHVIGIFSSYILISLLMTAFAFYYAKRLIPSISEKPKEMIKIDKKRVLKFTGFLTIASISTVFFSYIDSVMLGFFLKPEYVGYYRAAFSLVIGVSAIIFAPTSILLPIFTKLAKKKTQAAINQIFKYLSILAIPASFGLFTLGKYFIRFFYGYSYLPASLPLYFLSFILIPFVYVSVLLQLFSAEEKPQIFAILITIISLVNVVLNYILIKSLLLISEIWATAGAAIATLISWVLYFVLSIYFAKKETKTRISFSHLLKPVIASVVMASAIFYITNFFKDITFVIGALEVLLGVFVYFAILFVINGIKKEDLEMIKMLKKV